MKKLSRRERYLIRTYGITQKQYDFLLKKQDGVCAVCKKPPKPGKNLSVDHSHKPPGYIRGLLDTYCNRYVIGRHTDPDLLLSAARYLSQNTGWIVPPKKKKKWKKSRG